MAIPSGFGKMWYYFRYNCLKIWGIPTPVCPLAGNDVFLPPLYDERCLMYLSIGNDMAVRDSAIIGIFDLDNTSTSKKTREFLEKSEKEGDVVPCDDLPKSFVLTTEYGFTRVRLTSLSAATLEKRLEHRR